MLDAKFVGLTCGSRPNAEIKCVHSTEQRWVLHSCRLPQSIRFSLWLPNFLPSRLHLQLSTLSLKYPLRILQAFIANVDECNFLCLPYETRDVFLSVPV
jgi:hypothetical protein